MQFLQSHSYILIHSIFLINLLLTTRLFVSFYQSANEDYQCNYFHHFFKELSFFLKYLKKFQKRPFSEILGPGFTLTFKPFLRENGDKYEV